MIIIHGEATTHSDMLIETSCEFANGDLHSFISKVMKQVTFIYCIVAQSCSVGLVFQ